MTFPNVHIIGVQKAATTSLFYWLGQHKDIYAPLSAKDYPIFSDDRLWEKGLDDYTKLFSDREKQRVILAGSVHTLKFDYAGRRLFDVFPDSKLIVVLRDPVDRLLSAYNYRSKAGVEPFEFTKALSQEKLRSKCSSFEDRSGGAYVEHGFYCSQLKKILKYFPSNQLKIVWFEDIINTPEVVVKDIFQFLNVESDCQILFKKKNVTGKIRNQWFFNLCFGQNKLRKWLVENILGKAISLEKRTKIRHWLKEKNTSHSKKIDPIGFSRTELISIYREDIKCLESLTGRDLTSWMT